MKRGASENLNTWDDQFRGILLQRYGKTALWHDVIWICGGRAAGILKMLVRVAVIVHTYSRNMLGFEF
jgi:hypothetical protein